MIHNRHFHPQAVLVAGVLAAPFGASVVLDTKDNFVEMAWSQAVALVSPTEVKIEQEAPATKCDKNARGGQCG